MYVLTADQHASRRHGDRVDAVLAELTARIDAAGWTDHVLLPFERTVGDEVQGVVTSAAAATDLALHLQRLGEWAVGVGAGPLDEPLGPTSRASSGPAFVAAREAVERARSRTVPVPLAVAGANEDAARDAEAILALVAAVARRRSDAGWAAIDAVRGRTQREAARLLGVTPQAVSQRLRAAAWEVEVAARPVATRLLAAAAGPPGDTGPSGETQPGHAHPPGDAP